ncbi:phage antirepressor [Tissierella praeacuta]|uniref:phage antirepressor n=1 Tax=Tissierella praeacuta TaxID=43131 RepID=UPI0028B0C289|nr:phage antirepressor [Tissierella praeacuta]
MEKLKVFENSNFGKIRVLEIDGEPWFIAIDIAKVLDYRTAYDMTRILDEDEKGTQIVRTPGGNQNVIVIDESGLYSSILRSRKPEAKQFKKWVTSEVLPSIRKYGAYLTEQTVEKALTDPDFLIQLALNLKEEREKRLIAETELQENKPKIIFANCVETSRSSCLVGELAKLINQGGYPMGQNRLFAWMRDNGYLIRQKGENYNLPTQYSMDLKLMEVKKNIINNPDGTVRVTRTTKITGKGQIYFLHKFLGERAYEIL